MVGKLAARVLCTAIWLTPVGEALIVQRQSSIKHSYLMGKEKVRDAEYGDDTAHGQFGSQGTKGSHSASDSNLVPGTILGKKGSQVPLVQVEHTGMRHDLKEACRSGQHCAECCYRSISE